MKKVILISILLVTGCAHNPKPFIEGGIGYRFNQHVDGALYDCLIPAFLKVGVEYDNYIQVGIKHDSNIDCGRPFNERKEFNRDYFFISSKIGGQ